MLSPDNPRLALDQPLDRIIFDHTPDAIFLADDEGRYVEVNPAACELLGYSREELLRMSIWDVSPPHDVEQGRALWGDFLRGGHVSGEYELQRKDGTLVSVEYSAVANIRDGLHLSTVRDLSERQRHAGLMAASDEPFRRVVDHISDVITVLDADGVILYKSPAVKRVLGYEPDELVGRSAFDFIHPDDIHRVKPAFDSWRFAIGVRRYRFRHRDGSWRPLEAAGTAYKDEHGARRLVVASRDLTERHRGYAESQLLQSVSWRVAGAPDFDAAVASVLDIACDSFWAYGEVWHVSSDRHWLELSPVWCAAAAEFELFREGTQDLRLPSDTGIPGQVWQTKKPVWIPDVCDAPVFVRRDQARAAGLHAALGLPITLDGGETVTAVLVLFSAAPKAEDKRLVELFSAVAAQLGVAMQRKRAEQELRSSEALLQSVITSAPVIIFVTDAEGVVTLSEGQGLAGLGLQPGEFVGRSLFTIYGDMPEIVAQLRQGLGGETFTGFADVANRFFQVWYSPRRGANDEVVGLLGVAVDITERRQLEEQLWRAQRLESIGLLAGGIAHDFNNMLTAITGYAELLLDELTAQDPMREDVAQISAVAQRAGLLTYQLLAFSRQQVLRPMPLNLHEAATDVIRMLRRVIGEDIEIIVAGGHDLDMVNADPGQIGQVIMNLAVNARDAMPTGGRLTIETANVELGPELAGSSEPVVPGPYVMISVADTGSGMPPEVRERVFEPFFTTKPIGKGTGMGLATVYGIVRQSGGHIVVESEAGRGSTFRIYVPVARETERVREMPGSEANLARGRETVLLVEDEEVVRRLVKRALESCGYTVLEAADGLHALAVTDQEGVHIDILITDVVMPNMSGSDLVERLSADRPGLRVLYMSGYAADAMRHRGFAAGSMPFIQKPFTMRALTQKVRSILDAPND